MKTRNMILLLTLLALAALLSIPVVAQIGSWALTGSMNVTRAAHSMTLLPNGKVLVAGGTPVSGGGATATAELYDPNTGLWTYTNPMNEDRYGHSATLLHDGRVLFAGRAPYNYTTSSATAEIYDPATEQWTYTGSMSGPRSAQFATIFNSGPLSGYVLVAGGGYYSPAAGGWLDTAELYNPNTGTWTLTGSIHTARNALLYYGGALLPNGSYLIVGGLNDKEGRYNCPNASEVFNQRTQKWTWTSRRANTAQGGTVLLPNGNALAAGGCTGSRYDDVNTAQLYNRSTNVWTATTSMSVNRLYPSLTVLFSGQVLAAGGQNGGYGYGGCNSSAELYDPPSGKWLLAGNMSAPRFLHPSVLLPSGKVLVAGGAGGDGCGSHLSSAEIYTPPYGTAAVSGNPQP